MHNRIGKNAIVYQLIYTKSEQLVNTLESITIRVSVHYCFCTRKNEIERRGKDKTQKRGKIERKCNKMQEMS